MTVTYEAIQTTFVGLGVAGQALPPREKNAHKNPLLLGGLSDVASNGV